MPALNAHNDTAVLDGISIRLETAPLWRRVCAALIDYGIVGAFIYLGTFVFFIIIAAVVAAVAIVAPQFLESDEGGTAGAVGAVIVAASFILFLLLALLCSSAYFIYYECKYGQTLGKRLLALRVVDLHGGRVSLQQCVLRELARLVDVGLIFPGMISIALTKKQQRLGDILAKTLVLYSHRADHSRKTIYLDYQRFLALSARIAIREIPESWRTTYLPFAYSRFITNPRGADPAHDQIWVSRCSQELGVEFPEDVSSEERLRFVAEMCVQGSNNVAM